MHFFRVLFQKLRNIGFKLLPVSWYCETSLCMWKEKLTVRYGIILWGFHILQNKKSTSLHLSISLKPQFELTIARQK